MLDANERPAEAVKKQLLINASDPNEIRVAIREQERVVEVYVERKGRKSLAGNIYKGRVQNVLPGMEAAFVDIGLERNGFLYVDEVTPAAADSDQAMPVKLATSGSDDDVADSVEENGGAVSEEASDADSQTAAAADVRDAATVTVDVGDESEAAGQSGNTETSTDGETASSTGDDSDSSGDSDGKADKDDADATGQKGQQQRRRRGSGKARMPQKRKIQELLRPGQEILVQVVKDPMGTKGSRLTTQYSLAGRYIVYVPDGEGLGVSRRLADKERERLRGIVKELELPNGGGLIIRTAAEGALEDDIARDLKMLLAFHEKLMEQSVKQKAPKLLYNEADLSLRLIRDLFNDEVEEVIVDDQRQYQRIVSYLKRTSPQLTERVRLHEGTESLFDTFGVEQAIRSTLSRRANLPGGGYLIIDYAEAFTVIDVNTGRNVGKASLEETITKTNMEAAEEVVRQLRLRDIGGIIVVDFIDMNLMKNRDAVLEHFRKELSKDRTKTYLVEISPLGLVEMTRQNVSDGVREILTSSCRDCEGKGVVVSAETQAIDVERAIVQMADGVDSDVGAMAIDVAPAVHAILSGTAGRRREVNKRAGRLVRLFPDPGLESNAFALRATGSEEEISEMAEPLYAGQQLKLVVEKVDPLNEDDGIVVHNGTCITIVGAGGDVGSQKTVRIEASAGTRALATIVKPVRKRRRRGGRGRKSSGMTQVVQVALPGAAPGDEDLPTVEDIVDLTMEETDADVGADVDDAAAEIPERLLLIGDEEDSDGPDDSDDLGDDVEDVDDVDDVDLNGELDDDSDDRDDDLDIGDDDGDDVDDRDDDDDLDIDDDSDDSDVDDDLDSDGDEAAEVEADSGSRGTRSDGVADGGESSSESSAQSGPGSGTGAAGGAQRRRRRGSRGGRNRNRNRQGGPRPQGQAGTSAARSATLAADEPTDREDTE